MCAVGVLFTHSVDYQETKMSSKRNKKHSFWDDLKNHCSLQDEDYDESQFHVDHESLHGYRRDDECVVEEG